MFREGQIIQSPETNKSNPLMDFLIERFGPRTDELLDLMRGTNEDIAFLVRDGQIRALREDKIEALEEILFTGNALDAKTESRSGGEAMERIKRMREQNQEIAEAILEYLRSS